MSHNIDKIYYINLDKRTDRKEQIEKELNDYGLNYERFSAMEYQEFGAYGCALSHLAILKEAKQKGYKNVWILEDDFTFEVSKETFEKQLEALFNLESNFDVCMCAYNMKECKELEPSNEYFSKILFAQTTSLYIVNSHYYDKLINLYEWANPLLFTTRKHWEYANDIVWKNLQRNDNWIYFKNRIGKQRASYSDCANAYYDYNV